MRIFLEGEGPAVDALKEVLCGGGHEFSPSVATADAWLLLPPFVNRIETSRDLVRLAPRLSAPVLVCLVSFEPSVHWPANFCHVCEGTLRGNAAYKCPVTRTHFRTPLPARDSELLLGADTDEAAEALRVLWQPCSSCPAPLAVERVYPTEQAAEQKLRA